MEQMQLKVATLRRQKGVTQQELASAVGVSYQTVSKWETGISMPDITLLPALSAYFDVTIDQLLGVKSLPDDRYRPAATGQKQHWGEHLDYLKQSRTSFWNMDYLQFLISSVWHIQSPVRVLDCGCGYGALGLALLPLLPSGSSYTGIDFNETLLLEGKQLFFEAGLPADFVCADVLDYTAESQYDLVVCQAVLRHLDNSAVFLRQMVRFAAKGGLVACMEVNRVLESCGVYIHGLDYGMLCRQPGMADLWQTELAKQGRDYAAAMKLPELMVQAGLQHVDVRMNDKVSFVSPQSACYEQAVSDFVHTHGFTENALLEDETQQITFFVNHGMDRRDASAYCRKQKMVASYVQSHLDQLSFVHFWGFLISFGTK